MDAATALKTANSAAKKLSALNVTDNALTTRLRKAWGGCFVGKLVLSCHLMGLYLYFYLRYIGLKNGFTEFLFAHSDFIHRVAHFYDVYFKNLFSAALFIAIFVIGLPILVGLILRVIVRPKKLVEVEGENPAGITDELVARRSREVSLRTNRVREKSIRTAARSWILALLLALASAGLYALGEVLTGGFRLWTAVYTLLIGAGVFLVSMIVLIPVTRLLVYRLSPTEEDVTVADLFWMDNDPAERERRRQESQDSSDSRIVTDTDRSQPKLCFKARNVYGASRITVYMDGEWLTAFDGGHDEVIRVAPGHHILQMQVNSDLDARSYCIGPLEKDFDEYGEYTIEYN